MTKHRLAIDWSGVAIGGVAVLTDATTDWAGTSDRDRPPARKRNVTLKDVATRAGVSAMTVSRALSGQSKLVTAETAQRCMAAARELGYVPNLMARSLRGQQLRTIVMFAEYISSHHYLAELVDITSRTIESRGYGVICCQSLQSFHQSLRQFNLGGAVVIAPPESFYTDPFGESNIGPLTPPATVLLHSALEQTDFTEVSPDIADLCYKAARHLLDLGHTHFGYIGGPEPSVEPHWFEVRRRGFLKAMQERGLGADHLVRQPCANPDMGPGAVVALMDRAPKTTGFFCISDEIAIAAIAGAQAEGYDVPGDLSFVGCNNIHLSKFVNPSLTTLAIDVAHMVDRALELLLENGHAIPDGKPLAVKIPVSLIVRDSTASPGARRSKRTRK